MRLSDVVFLVLVQNSLLRPNRKLPHGVKPDGKAKGVASVNSWSRVLEPHASKKAFLPETGLREGFVGYDGLDPVLRREVGNTGLNNPRPRTPKKNKVLMVTGGDDEP